MPPGIVEADAVDVGVAAPSTTISFQARERAQIGMPSPACHPVLAQATRRLDETITIRPSCNQSKQIG